MYLEEGISLTLPEITISLKKSKLFLIYLHKLPWFKCGLDEYFNIYFPCVEIKHSSKKKKLQRGSMIMKKRSIFRNFRLITQLQTSQRKT